MNKLTLNDEQTLWMILPYLHGVYKCHCLDLLSGIDPTGGMIPIDDQVYELHRQYMAETSEFKD